LPDTLCEGYFSMFGIPLPRGTRTPPESFTPGAWRGAPKDRSPSVMRRGLAFTSVFLFLAGLELSTEGISLILARMRTGAGALVAGTQFHVSGARYIVGLLAVLVAVAVWGLLVWSASQIRRITTVGAICPQCGNRTRRVRRKGWQRLLSFLLGERITRRRCETCGWTGLSLKQ